MQTQLVYPKEKSLFAILATLAVIFWLLIIVGTFGIALFYVLMFFILYLFAQSGFISYIKGTAVRITPEQFPQLHARIVACTEKVGLRKVPEAYLLRSDGIFNAFATKFLGRNYIALYTELVDALEDRPEALNFYIGHELGHLHRQHLKYGPFLAPVAWLPLLGAAYSRAREYTCDRYGLLCSASVEDAVHAVGVLAAGGRHAQHLNTSAYADQRKASSGFWMSFHELVADYPWLVKRLHAVSELGQQREPTMPGRHALAWLFAFFVPRTGMPGGGGFLIVVAIVGILAAIAIPQFQEYQTKAKAAAFMSDSRNVQTLLAANSATVDEANALLDALKTDPASRGLTVSSANLSFGTNGAVEIEARDPALQGASLRFSPEVSDDDAVTWHCEVTHEGKVESRRLAWCE